MEALGTAVSYMQLRSDFKSTASFPTTSERFRLRHGWYERLFETSEPSRRSARVHQCAKIVSDKNPSLMWWEQQNVARIPSFTKTKSGIRDAIRGYRELHLRAFKLLSRDGILATFSCSHHISDAILSETISAALVDARRSARRLRRFEQALDHPVLPTMPETEYFKGVLLEMKPSI